MDDGHSDHLSNEFSIEATLTETGVKASAKSRFISALDRLFGGIADFPAAFFEGKAAQRRLEDDLRRQETKRRKELSIESDIRLVELERAAQFVERQRQISEAFNKAAVVTEALKDFRENRSSVDDSSEVEEDWLNVFGNYASNASSERLRQLWGKILSGEIRKPGSFSLTTLRVLSEMDQQTAVLFQRHVVAVITGGLIIQQESPKGAQLIEMTFLEEVGLLQDVNGMLGLDQKFDDQGRWVWENGNLAIIAEGTAGAAFRIPLIKISRAGEEIRSILPAEQPDVSLRRLSKILEPAATSVNLVVITDRPAPGMIRHAPLEKLK